MKKRKPLEVFKIKVSIYGVVLYVLVGNRDVANHWCSKKYEINNDKALEDRWVYQFTSVSRTEGPSDYLIYLSSFHCTGGEISSLAHEIMHATTRILTDLGLTLSSESEEAYAYLTGWLMDEILHRLAGAELLSRGFTKKGKKKKRGRR